MNKKLHIIYVPGLGDHKLGMQARVIKAWSSFGVETEIFAMIWADKRSWNEKFQLLLDRIDSLAAAKVPVGLVGVSAGGSAVINAYAARKDKLVGVVCIAGKINRPTAIGPRYHNRNPSFVSSAYDSEKSLKTLDGSDRQRIRSIFGLIDPLVRKKDSFIPGAQNRTSLSFGHVMTIGIQITLGAAGNIHFLKKQLRKKQN